MVLGVKKFEDLLRGWALGLGGYKFRVSGLEDWKIKRFEDWEIKML